MGSEGKTTYSQLDGGWVLGLTVGSYQITGPGIALGAITGIVYGILAVGLVIVYRQSRVINFAHGEIGAFGATFVGLAVVAWHLPYWTAFPMGLALSASAGAATEVLVIRRLRRAPLVISVIATLGVGEFVDQLSSSLNRKVQAGSVFPQPPGLPQFHLGPLLVTRAYSGMILMTPVVVAALILFLRKSRVGLAMRATAANPDAASLAGVRSGATSALAWALAGGLAAFTATLVLPTRGFTSGSFLGPELLLRALAAAVVARMASMPIAMAAGIAIGVMEQVVISNDSGGGLVSAVLFVIILIALLLQRQRRGRDEDKDAWASVQSTVHVPDRLKRSFILRNMGRLFAGVLLCVGLVLPLLVDATAADVLIVIVGFGIIGLSVGLITSLGGALSLGQFAIAGVGATTSYVVASRTHNFILAFLAAAVVAAASSLVIGLPAIRIRGIMLGVTTLAFALASQNWLFSRSWMLGRGVVPGVPSIGGLKASTPKSYYYFALFVLLVSFWLASNVWRGNVGMRLRAVRDNEDGARAFGLHPVSVKLQAFILAGCLAGWGGAVIGHSLSYLEPSAFPFSNSIDAAAMAAVGGLGSVLGPIIGALYIVGVPHWIPLDSAGLAATALGWVVLIVHFPGGLAQSTATGRAKLIAWVGHRDERRFEEASTRRSEGSAGDQVTTTLVRELPRPRQTHAEQGSPLLSGQGLTKSYGGVRAVSDVSIDVMAGETLGLIGPNGAGKTTLFELLSGFAKPDSGRVTFDGQDVTRLPPDRRAALGLVRSFQDVFLFPTMTVLEVVTVSLERLYPTRVGSVLVGMSGRDRRRQARALELVHAMGLADYRDREVRVLSTGTRRIVELACLVALEPSLLLMDEPSGGIAQRETEALGALLLNLKSEHRLTLMIIEHDIPLLMSVSDRVIAMESGTILTEGTPEEVRNSPLVIHAYLGGDPRAVERSNVATTRAHLRRHAE